MPTRPNVIFFDAVGTLIYLPQSVGTHYRAVALEYGVDPDAAALDLAFRHAWKVAPERAVTTDPRPDDDKGWWRDLVANVLDTVLTPAERQRFDFLGYFEAVYAHFAEPGVWAAFPDVRDALLILRDDGHRLGIISNFDRRLCQVLADLGLAALFEHIVISSEIGTEKPDPRIFAEALKLFGVAPDRALHVGDDPVRDGGAETAGLQVFYLDRSRQTLHDVVAFVRDTSRP